MTAPSPAPDQARRLLVVHAHPDDETINTGATMALYAARGVQVTLVTCTRGEQGEVIPAELAHLAADRDDTLGAHREIELAAAMAALGVSDHRILGYRDSGMAFDASGRIVVPADARPNAFARADLEMAAAALTAVLLQTRPHVVVTYDPGGGYGHPDHIRAHEVTMRAVELAAVSGWEVPKVYWVVLPKQAGRAAIEATLAGRGTLADLQRQWQEHGVPSMFVDDELVTSVVDGSAVLDRKIAALGEHATQITVDGAFFALSNGIEQPVMAIEYYRLVKGTLAGDRDEQGREIDLFAGTA